MEQPETKVTVLPPAGREEQLEQWGVDGSAHWSGVDAGHHVTRQTDEEFEKLGFLVDGGWSPVDTTRGSARGTGFTPGARDAGMTSHRGVLHPDEFVDSEALQAQVENELGFSYAEVRSVYRQGRKSDATLELRARIDARLLELSRAGSNIALLGRLLGFHVNASGACEALNNALERARKESI